MALKIIKNNINLKKIKYFSGKTSTLNFKVINLIPKDIRNGEEIFLPKRSSLPLTAE